MATKNISRTVIEGGRASGSKTDRYKSNRTHRYDNRKFARQAKLLEDLDDAAATPKRKEIYKEFRDKLGPMYRWLRSKVGCKWDAIFSELVSKFDTRTIAGHHVVYGHLLGSITLKMTSIDAFGERLWGYYVNQSGILSYIQNKPRHDSYAAKQRKIYSWSACRTVMDYGTSIFG